MMKVRKILSISFQVVLFAMMAAGGALFAAGHLGYSVLIKPYVVMSGSMEPAVPLGSVVFVKPKQFGYSQGDIITFLSGTGKDLPVTHRVEALAQEGENPEIVYQTKGDVNNAVDQGLVHKDQVIGAVTLSVPYVGYAVDFAKKPQGFILLVVVPATIIIYEELKHLGKEIGRGFRTLLFWLRRRRQAIAFEFKINLLPKKEPHPFPLASAVVPFLGALFVTMAVSGAFFFDAEVSLANVLGAASSFGDQATANVYDSNPFTCPGGASTTDTVFGTVTIDKTDTTVTAIVTLAGATADSSYDIWINQDPGGCPQPGPTEVAALTTDTNGDGTGDASAPLVGGATNFWVSVVGGGQVLRSTAVSF